MTRLRRFFARLFRRKPVTVVTYRRRETRTNRAFLQMTARLAHELGRQNPMGGEGA